MKREIATNWTGERISDKQKRKLHRVSVCFDFYPDAHPDSNDKIMIQLFKALVRTVLTYGYPVLISADKKIWDRLQINQNKGIRAAMGLPPYTSVDFIHEKSNIPRIEEYSKLLLRRSIARAQTQHDEQFKCLLSDIANSQWKNNQNHKCSR